MSAHSEGDETPLWLDAHACQEARSGGTDAPAGRANGPARPAGIQLRTMSRGPERTCPQDTRGLHSHSERIVGRSRAFMDNPG